MYLHYPGTQGSLIWCICRGSRGGCIKHLKWSGRSSLGELHVRQLPSSYPYDIASATLALLCPCVSLTQGPHIWWACRGPQGGCIKHYNWLGCRNSFDLSYRGTQSPHIWWACTGTQGGCIKHHKWFGRNSLGELHARNSPHHTLMIWLQLPRRPYAIVSSLTQGPHIWWACTGPQGGCIKHHKWLGRSSIGELHGRQLPSSHPYGMAEARPWCSYALVSPLPIDPIFSGHIGAPGWLSNIIGWEAAVTPLDPGALMP